MKLKECGETGEFYSNCLFETIKAKIKDWKNVKITYIPAKYNEIYCIHFLWSDGKNDYDFGVERYLKWYERLWFKGKIRKRRLGWNKEWKACQIARYKRKQFIKKTSRKGGAE